MWRPEDPQGNEADKVRFLVVPYTRGRGIDLGCGPQKAFPHFIGVDNCSDTERYGIPIQPDVTIEDCCALPFETGELDFVFSSHLLEHVVDTQAALTEWWRVIKPGGHLVLYLPHADLYPNIGEPGANPDHKVDLRPADIRRAMGSVAGHAREGWDLLVDEVRSEGREYSFLVVFRKRADRLQLEPCRKPRPDKTVCLVRYGGFGDMLQASGVLPALRRAGFHITVMTTPAGQDILRHDPHIDAWIIQDKDQVPNHQLHAYWEQWAPRFDRFVNFSESVEGTLLALPGRANHGWPASVRRVMLGRVNYGEFTAALAQVPYRSEARFYASAEEIAWAREYRAAIPAKRLIVYALAGSSVHKVYPWQDAVIAQVLTEMPDAAVVLVGDHYCKVLEQGWENEPRVIRTSGELSIRETLTLAQIADCVVGPETGVLNAVAFEPTVAKVLLLSHSSHENLTKHWVRTAALVPPKEVGCYPCHRLHYGDKYCPTDPETGTALCAMAIDPADVFDAIRRLLGDESDEARRVA